MLENILCLGKGMPDMEQQLEEALKDQVHKAAFYSVHAGRYGTSG